MSKPFLGFLASRVFEVPLLITDSKLSEILRVLGPRIGMDADNIYNLGLQTTLNPNRYYSKPSNNSRIAIIPIYGTLVHRGAGINALSGLTSYAQISESFSAAMNSRDIDTILFDIDSSGGEVSGNFDLADEIYASRGKKPIIAFVNDSGFSGAYSIASAADKIYLTRTAGVGSIGVKMVHADVSERDAKEGIKYTVIYEGERKNDFSPHAPLSTEARKIAQQAVKSAYDVFVSTVARNNGLSKSDIINTQAAIYIGQSAVDAGLADAVMSYNEVISTLTGGKKQMLTRNAIISDPAVNTAHIEEQTNVETAGTEQLDNIPEPAQVQSQTPTPAPVSSPDPLTAAIESERARVLEIIECCTLADFDLTTELISNGSSADTARKMVLSILAEKSKQDNIVSAVNPITNNNNPDTNPLIDNAKKRAKGIY